jgi:hypothetical protein
MNVIGRRFAVSMLLVVVAFLALTSISPANAALSTAVGTVLRTATYAHTGQAPIYAHTGQAPTYAHTGQAPIYAHTGQAPTYAHTGYTAQNPTVTYAHTWHTAQDPSTTYSHAWHTTGSRTWSQTWSTTWSRRTHVYPTYTSTEYVPIQVPGCDSYDPSCYGYNGYYGYYPTPGCDPTNPYCNGYYGYYQTPGCDPTNPYCSGYQTPNNPSTQPPVTACDPNNPYCNPALQTINSYQQTSQTAVVNQPPSQTLAPYQPQTVPVTQSQSQDLTPLIITIIGAAAVAVLLMSRKSRPATTTQPGQVSSSAQASSAAQSGLPFCPQCGTQIPTNSQFCRFCGSAQ